MVPAGHRAISSLLGGLGLEENAATMAGFRVTRHGHDEDENARDEIGRIRYD